MSTCPPNTSQTTHLLRCALSPHQPVYSMNLIILPIAMTEVVRTQLVHVSSFGIMRAETVYRDSCSIVVHLLSIGVADQSCTSLQ